MSDDHIGDTSSKEPSDADAKQGKTIPFQQWFVENAPRIRQVLEEKQETLRQMPVSVNPEPRTVPPVDLRSTPAGRETTNPQGPVCYVTLLMMASIVNRKKRTLERLKETGKLPDPDVKGKKGTPNEWDWSVVRPVLENEYNRKLPEVFPADPFIRS